MGIAFGLIAISIAGGWAFHFGVVWSFGGSLEDTLDGSLEGDDDPLRNMNTMPMDSESTFDSLCSSRECVAPFFPLLSGSTVSFLFPWRKMELNDTPMHDALVYRS